MAMNAKAALAASVAPAPKKIKLSSLRVDTKSESEGEWIEVKEWAGLVPDRPWEVTKLPGLRFRVKSINDSAYKSARQKAVESLEMKKKDYPDEVIPEDVAASAEGRVISDGLLLEWDGFDEPYSKDIADEMLTHPDGRNLRGMIVFCAAKVGKREVEFVEQAAKN